MKQPVGYELGRSIKEFSSTSVIKSDKKKDDRKVYPTITVTEKEMPYLDDLNVGDKISLITLYKVVRIEDSEKTDCNYTLEINKVAEESGMKISKALEKFMGEHKEVTGEETSNDNDKNEGE